MAEATFEPDNEPSILFPGVDREEYKRCKQNTEVFPNSMTENGIFPEKEYDPFRVPPDFDAAKRHAVCCKKQAKKVANFQKKLAEDDEEKSHYCPCCGNPFEAERFSLLCSLSELSELGEGFPLHYHLVRCVVGAFLAALLVAGVYCLNQNYKAKRISEWDATLDSNMIMESSLGNFGRHSSPSALQPWLHVFCMWLFLALHQYLAHTHRRMCTEFDRCVITPSDYTCEFRGLPSQFSEAEIIAFAEKLIPSCEVAKVNPVYDIGEYMKADALHHREKITRMKIGRKKELMAGGEATNRCFLCPRSTPTLESSDFRLSAASKLLQSLRDSLKSKFIGTVFVTFQQDEMAKAIASKYGKRKASGFRYLCSCFSGKTATVPLSFRDCPIVIRRAPEPDDLLWANLAVTKAERRRKRLVTYLATACVLLICVGIIFGSSESKKAIRDRKRSTPNPTSSDNFVFSLLTFLPSILVVLTNQTLGIVIRKFSFLERHKTLTHFNSSVLKKLTVAMFLNTAIVAIAVHWGTWYEPGGLTQEIYNISIANAIIPPVLTVAGPKIAIRKLRQWLAMRKGEKSLMAQTEAQALFEGVPLDMAQRCAVFMKTYMLTLFYAPVLPLVYVIGAVALVLQYWVDKFMLLRVNSRPDVLSHELDDAMLGFLALGTVLYAATNLLFFSDFGQMAVAPGVVGIVTTVAYTLLPVRKAIKALRRRAPVGMEVQSANVMSESEKSYKEVMIDFTDDYDRCNPVTSSSGKSLWLSAIAAKQSNFQHGDELFPGVEPDPSTQPTALGSSTLMRKALGISGPKRIKPAAGIPAR